LIDRLFCWS